MIGQAPLGMQQDYDLKRMRQHFATGIKQKIRGMLIKAKKITKEK